MTSPDPTAIAQAVRQLYNTYPFPPDPLSSEPPPGYNWRWSWRSAHSFCLGHLPSTEAIRILDAGCGTGSGTEYLSYLNPEARVVAIDLSEGALATAQDRFQRSGILNTGIACPNFHHLSLYDIDQLEGEFNFINCVGVLHHLPDPIRGIQALASKLAPGGLLHIFVYAELGRWEIRLMQQAIRILQGNQSGDYQDGVAVGRQLFQTLPETNRLVQYEKRRWAYENQRDANFADMYCHPQEIDYTIDTLFELIEASGLTFLGFSDPDYWHLDRLLGSSPDLQQRTQSLTPQQTYRLIELLDPEVSHYEFYLGKPPIVVLEWTDESTLLRAIPHVSPCLHGWPNQSLLDYRYQPLSLTDPEFQFMQACDGSRSVAEVIQQHPLRLDEVRSLQKRQLILLKAV